jgi:signal transduction histidine kinase/FixJ family two-component response regulator
VLVTEDLFSSPEAHRLLDALRQQPTWSDVPILFLSGSGADSAGAAWAIELLGNVTVLERPVRVTTLISALRTAVRARRRQYELRDQFVELTTAEAGLRRQGDRQRLLGEAAAVLLTTNDPDAMMRQLFEKIAPHFALDAFFNFMVSDRGSWLRLESYAGIAPEEAQKMRRLAFGEAICGKVAETMRGIVRTHIQMTSAPEAEMVKRFGLRVYACNPLIADGRLLGTLSFASRRRDEFDADELEFFQTIAHYVTATYERIRLIRELKDADRRKDEFLATLAHELRNPLAPIRNSLDVMRLASSEPNVIEQARIMMERQLGHMVRLIDDLLDVSRITRGKLELRKERTELATVVNTAVETTRPLIQSAGHALTVSLPPKPVYLDADPVRMAQVFSNLLNNGAKYMERGGRLWLTAELAGDELSVSVRDAGIGIPRDALAAVFDMFAQVDQSLERAQGGLGIGLTLVKRLVEMHGGRVEARSEGVGKGSEFIVRLPVAAPAGAAQSSVRENRLARHNGSRRILIADDNRDSAESMGMLLQLMGNEVRMVHDGMAAVEEAAVFLPEIVLLDIGMPRMSGYEVARRIRAEPWGADMILVALTGWGQDDDKRRAYDAGFDRHFTKPVNPTVLEELLTEAHASVRSGRRAR